MANVLKNERENVIVINGIRYELRYRRLPENARYDEERCRRCALKDKCCRPTAPICRLFPGYGGIFVTKRLSFEELQSGLLEQTLYSNGIRLGKVEKVYDSFRYTRRHVYVLDLLPSKEEFPFTYEECVRLIEGHKVVFAAGADKGEQDNHIDVYELKDEINI